MTSLVRSNPGVAARDIGSAGEQPLAVRASGFAAVRRRTGYLVVGAWAVNISLLIAGFAWLYFFGASRETILTWKYVVAEELRAVDTPEPGRRPDTTTGHLVRLVIGVSVTFDAFVAAICALPVMLGSLFAGPARFRTMRMWFVFTAATCGWLGLVTNWPSIHWAGQQRRMRAAVPAANTLAEKLKKDWPKVDSELPDIGPFLAYPLSGPTALLPLTQATFPASDVRFSAVERTGDGVMRFELAGSEAGAWLEWRADGSEPASFVGGLNTEYVVVKAARLSADWFLVRYRAAGLVEHGAGTSPQTR